MFHAGYEGITIIVEKTHQYADYFDFLQFLHTRMNHQREYLIV